MSDTAMDVQIPSEIRFKKALTLQERIQVIKEYERTPNTRLVARMFGCGRTQIQTILRHRHEILNEWKNDGDPYRIRKRQSVRLLTLGAVVYEWIQRCRSKSIIVFDDDIRQTAEQVAQLLNIHEFKPSNRWLLRLKTKYKLGDLGLLGLDPTINGRDIAKKSLNIKEIIDDLKVSGMGDNNLQLPKDAFQFLTKEENVETSETEAMLSGAENSGADRTLSEYMYVLSDNYHTSTSESEQSLPTRPVKRATYGKSSKQPASAKEINSYTEALNHLGPLENFALMREDIRAIGLINQLENLYREHMSLSS